MRIAVTPAEDGFSFEVRVSPSSKLTRVLGAYGERLKVQVAAPPEDNRANEELMEAIAGWLGISPRYVVLVAGYKSRDKTIVVKGIEERDLRRRLAELAGGSPPL